MSDSPSATTRRTGGFPDFVTPRFHSNVPDGVALQPFEVDMMAAKKRRDVKTLLELAVARPAEHRARRRNGLRQRRR